MAIRRMKLSNKQQVISFADGHLWEVNPKTLDSNTSDTAIIGSCLLLSQCTDCDRRSFIYSLLYPNALIGTVYAQHQVNRDSAGYMRWRSVSRSQTFYEKWSVHTLAVYLFCVGVQ